MDKNFNKLRKVIYSILLKEGGYYFSSKGEMLPEPAQNKYFDGEEPYSPNTQGLSIDSLKYHLQDLPSQLKTILLAPDAQILDEPDQPIGIYSVHSKSLNAHFEFSYGNEDMEDWTVISPND